MPQTVKKDFLIHVTNNVAFLALISSSDGSTTVESMEGFFIEDLDAFKKRLDQFSADFSGAMPHAYISISGRYIDFYYHVAEKSSQLKTGEALAQICEGTLEIDLETHQVNILSPKTGDVFVPGESSDKDILVASIGIEKVKEWQNFFVDAHVYPASFEMSVLGTLGMLISDAELSSYTEPLMLIDLHDSFSYLLIVKDSKLTMVKKIATGINDFCPYIQESLGIGDPKAAKKMLFANSFDFSDKGEKIAERFLNELQAATGLYEIGTGEAVSSFIIPNLAKDFNWLRSAIVKVLDLNQYEVSYEDLFEKEKISFSDAVNVVDLDDYYLGLLSILGNR